jgi:Zn-dependent metalloprotease
MTDRARQGGIAFAVHPVQVRVSETGSPPPPRRRPRSTSATLSAEAPLSLHTTSSMTKRVFGLAALAATTASFLAQGLAIGAPQQPEHADRLPGTRPASIEHLLQDWRLEHGDSWYARTNPLTGTLEMLFGGNAAPSFEPDTNVESDWFRLGREWIAATEDMHGVSLDELIGARVFFLPLGQGNTTDKMTVRFDQVIDGVPVEDARVNVLFDLQGRLLSLHTTAAPTIDNPSTRPSFDAAFASLVAREAFVRSEGMEPNHYGAPELVFAHVDDQETRRWTLAWQVDTQWYEEGFEPKGYVHTIDARTRQVLKRAASVHHFDVTGTVSSMATPGIAADHAGNPPVATPMPYIRVQSSTAGTVYTDANGNFTFPGVNAPLNLTLSYNFSYNSGTIVSPVVNNGTNYSIVFNNVQPNQPNALLMNPTPTATVTAQANGLNWVAKQRDWIRSIFPNDDTADLRTTTNVNLAQTCNAFFNGSSTNYYAAGGNCNNTAFSSVVAHEMGHWLNVEYSTGNGSDGMGEGNADVFSIYMLDDPIVGRFFTTSGGAIRNATNNRQFCGDSNPGCYGAVHTDGEVWMGAAWKVRTRLNTSLGNVAGDLQSNLLFLGWMNSYNQTGIRSIIETQWLTLDDNDGNINNGTPNYAEIDGGFRQQGFPGFDLPFVVITNVTQLPTTTNQSGPYMVSADIVAGISPPVTTATLRYRVNGGAVQSLPMNNVGGSLYSAGIPGQTSPSVIEYVVDGQDSASHTASFPSTNIAQGLSFAVGQIATILTADFESGAAGWARTGGNATTGLWEVGNPNGSAAQPEDDHTPAPGVNCWFTGQAAAGAAVGTNDVDGGSTLLESPVFDLAGTTGARISYWRWYSNTQGGAPNADTFVIEISNNGGTSWVNFENVGPAGPEADGGWFRRERLVSEVITPTANMKLRFNASDLGTGSIVEAALDDVLITAVESTIPGPTTYCTTNPNSTGNLGTLAFGGSQRISLNNAELLGQGFPVASFGLFFFGSTQVQQPIPGTPGILCVGGSPLRLPVVQTDQLFGTVVYALDFTNPATNAQFITAGSTWNFQFWHRDAVGGVATANTSNGLNVQFDN